MTDKISLLSLLTRHMQEYHALLTRHMWEQNSIILKEMEETMTCQKTYMLYGDGWN